MVSRISKQEVVKQPPLVISIQNPDLMFVKDNPDVIKTDAKGLVISTAYSGKFGSGANIVGSSAGVSGPGVSGVSGPNVLINPAPDAPSLADIEKIDFEEYPDPLTGVAKYKVIIKIRNSSREKANVEGVDARVYNPNGAFTYSLGTGSASSGSNVPVKPTYISNVTWYNAVTTYNDSSKTIYTGPSVTNNAQYPSDGTGVPADSIVGGYSYRIKSVWRKTEAEALAAAAIK